MGDFENYFCFLSILVSLTSVKKHSEIRLLLRVSNESQRAPFHSIYSSYKRNEVGFLKSIHVKLLAKWTEGQVTECPTS